MSFSLSEVTLGEISLGNKGSYGIAAAAVDFSRELHTYLRITDINDDGTLNKNGLKSVDDVNSTKYFLKPNDIVFARTGGSTGRAYFYDGRDGKLVYAGYLIKFSLDPDKVNPKFMKYYSMSGLYKGWVDSFNTGSTRGNINAQTYADMKILLPNRKQQNLLVETLSCLDDKIELNNRINKTLEEIAQAIFRSWFIDFEPFQDGEFEDSELGKIPKGWDVKTIQDFTTDMKNGGTPSRKVEKYWNSNDVPWVKTGEISNTLIIDSEEYISYEGLQNSSAKLLPNNSVLMAMYGATAGKIGFLCFEASTNQACCAMICANLNKAIYLYLYLLHNQSYIEGLAVGAAQQNLSKETISKLKILLPPGEMIELSKMDALFILMEKNLRENRLLANIRDTLLPKLMSGEIRVPLKEA